MARQQRIDPVVLFCLALIITPVPAAIGHLATDPSINLVAWLVPIAIGLIGLRVVLPRLAPIDPCLPDTDGLMLLLVIVGPRLIFSYPVELTIVISSWLAAACIARARHPRIPRARVVTRRGPEPRMERSRRQIEVAPTNRYVAMLRLGSGRGGSAM